MARSVNGLRKYTVANSFSPAGLTKGLPAFTFVPFQLQAVQLAKPADISTIKHL
jgi:hypothetical protein